MSKNIKKTLKALRKEPKNTVKAHEEFEKKHGSKPYSRQHLDRKKHVEKLAAEAKEFEKESNKNYSSYLRREKK